MGGSSRVVDVTRYALTHCGNERPREHGNERTRTYGERAHERTPGTEHKLAKATAATTTRVLEAHQAARALAQSPVVPFKLKRPLVVSFLYGKLGSERLLPSMASTDYDNKKLRVHAICMSKPLTEVPRTTVLKRRHAAAVEAPICARVSDTHSLACAPNDAPDARWQFGFANGRLRRVADAKDGNSMKKTQTAQKTQKKTKKTKKTETPASSLLATDVVPLNLPSDPTAYDYKPWRRVRDVVAQAHFVAEEMRAAADKDCVFDIKRALSHMETCPFAWDFSAEPFLDSILFVVWTSGEKRHVKYHLNAMSAGRLCVKCGAKARFVKQQSVAAGQASGQ